MNNAQINLNNAESLQASRPLVNEAKRNIDKEELDCINKDCIIIDLASKPGGINFEYAKEKNIKVNVD